MTVELRSWALNDAPALLTLRKDSPDLEPQFGGAVVRSVEQAREYIASQLVFGATRRHWAVTVDGAVVGNVGLSGIERRHGTAWVSYWLSAYQRGKGYAVSSLATVVVHAFDDGLFRLELGHRVNNPASCRVATRAGFLAEGVERQKLSYGTERFDVETHSRLRIDPRPDVELLPLAG